MTALRSGSPLESRSRPLRCVTSPTAGVIASLMISRSLSVSSGSLVGIERPLVRGRGPGQLLGEGASGREGGRAEGERAEERAAAGSGVRRVHAIFTRVRHLDSWEARRPSATAGRPVVREIVASGPLARAAEKP